MDDEVPASRVRDDEVGGDPACWSHLVCVGCGRMTDSEAPTTCPTCGATMPAAGVRPPRTH